ncbi:L-2-amino-thiazoline-4-carboxylic acid hydrolase [Sinosporangium siamense]|uniref:L-2-amino-thiazoline-4-carboxylic acid hydrolase n=1 Tax=Sinosporangium siamense TaxID=1367973 RepID=A0A919REB1_9ACTN|nr:L-2-amino-thiazoline-4-carboxylic acid hydrolase [Sinosporangium siamense]GII90219.1 hypothetical protein Ssi02_04500 [Sinosporangium siamense]
MADLKADDVDSQMAELFDAYFAILEPDLPGMRQEIERRAQALVEARGDLLVDGAARYNVHMSAVLLATYNLLRERMPGAEAVEKVKHAFLDPMREGIRHGMTAALDQAPDPFSLIVEISKSNEEQRYGASFDFVRERDDEDAYLLEIRRCAYNDVLRGAGAPELVPVFCEFDRSWIEAIDPDRHGFAFDRPTTLAAGHGSCGFHWRRTRPASAGDD